MSQILDDTDGSSRANSSYDDVRVDEFLASIVQTPSPNNRSDPRKEQEMLPYIFNGLLSKEEILDVTEAIVSDDEEYDDEPEGDEEVAVEMEGTDDEESKEELYVLQRQRLKPASSPTALSESDPVNDSFESNGELQSKYEELLLYAKDLQTERDFYRGQLQQAKQKVSLLSQQHADALYGELRALHRQIHFLIHEDPDMNAIELVRKIEEQFNTSEKSDSSSMSDSNESSQDEEQNLFSNEDSSVMEAQLDDDLRKYEAKIYAQKKQHGYKDTRLEAVMNRCKEVRSQLRKVEDPANKREEKIKEIKMQQRRKGQGPLQLTEDKLQGTRSQLRKVKRELYD